MMKETLTVQNKLGVHARPASMIVDVTSRSIGEVFFNYNNTRVNAKSILNIMMLAIEPGAVIDVELDGENQEEIFANLQKIFEDKFNEDD
ncbi:MAG: HPr family phosphocarrier protein [Fibrobacterales bacterium]